MNAIAPVVAFTAIAERFHEIPDGMCILLSQKGVYRQSKLFRRGTELYAGYGGGFVRLYGKGGTSTPHLRYIAIDAPHAGLEERELGRLFLTEGAVG